MANNMQQPEWMTTQDAMMALRVSRRTLERWDANGTLTKTTRLPNGHRRFWRREIESILQPSSDYEAATGGDA